MPKKIFKRPSAARASSRRSEASNVSGSGRLSVIESGLENARRSASAGERPSSQGRRRPHRLNQTKRPCALQKPINRSQHAGSGESEDEPGRPVLQRVLRRQKGDGKKAEGG